MFDKSEEEDFTLYTEELKDLKEDYITMRKKYESDITRLNLEKEKLMRALKVSEEKEKNNNSKDKDDKISALEKQSQQQLIEHKHLVAKLENEIKTLEADNKLLFEETKVLNSKIKSCDADFERLTKTNNGK